MLGMRVKNPAHPGGIVKSEIVEALDLPSPMLRVCWA
jgi:plasmid maintenance system antidote protein VapI